MPKTFDFTDIERLVSSARLNSYRTAFRTVGKADLFGIYSWNLELSGALNSLLQLVEVALRNAINEAGKTHVETAAGQNWFDVVPFTLIEDETAVLAEGEQPPLIKAQQTKDFFSGISSAKKKAQRLLRKKLGEDTTAVPTLDQIISQTDFSVWEYILDKSFYDGDAAKKFIWPKGYITAFKKPPQVEGKNKQFQQRDMIRRRIETVRMLRNRVAHNEPVWKDVNTDDTSVIIHKLKDKINEVLELTYWISPVLYTYIKNGSIIHRLNILLCEHEINNSLYKNSDIDIVDLSSLNIAVTDIHSDDKRLLIQVNGKRSIIFSRKNRFN